MQQSHGDVVAIPIFVGLANMVANAQASGTEGARSVMQITRQLGARASDVETSSGLRAFVNEFTSACPFCGLMRLNGASWDFVTS
mmetsp:Transcript_85765/g.151930  ORF Transcript_85765/g.151930 Transcript_85765/m.151930 type:complete len:85 (-) Transcript_85765:123-377(-)